MNARDPSCTQRVIVDGALGPAARHGLRELRRALQAASVSFEECPTLDAAARGSTLLVVGLPGSPAVDEILVTAGIAAPHGPETTLIQRTRWQDRPLDGRRRRSTEPGARRA